MKKVLLIRFSSIGDIVLTTPVIRCVYEQWGAEVHVVTKKAFGGLLSANPYVHRIHELDNSLEDVINVLKAEHFDLVLDLHKNLRSLRLRMALGRPGVTFNKLNLKKWLLTQFSIDRLPRIHIVDRYFKALHHFGLVNDQKGLDFYIPPDQEIDMQQWLGKNASPFVTAVLGAAHATKQIPAGLMADIIKQLHLPVVLIGGPAEKELGSALMEGDFSVPVINLTGMLSIHQSASVIHQSAAVLTPDTGMMHIATALRRPIISVWGNTVPEFGMYPYRTPDDPEGHDWEVKDLSCRPCSKIGFDTCPKGHFRCMFDQDAGAIAQSVNTWSRKNAPASGHKP